MFYGPEDIRMEDVPTPDPGPGEVLVRIEAALTCGTDVKSYKRGHPTLFKTMPSPFKARIRRLARRQTLDMEVVRSTMALWGIMPT